MYLSRLTMNLYKAIVQKGSISFFGSMFISYRIELIFGRLTCLGMKGWLFYNCFCWSALRFREITHMQKNSDFQAEFLGANLTKMDVDVTWMWTVTSISFNSTNSFKIDVLGFERSREKDQEKKLTDLLSNRFHGETNSNPTRSAPYSLLLMKRH